MILERRRDVNISLIISSAPVNTSLLSPPADCAPQKLTFGEKRMFGSVLFSRESGPQGHRAGICAFQQGVWPPGAPGWDQCFSAGSLAPGAPGWGWWRVWLSPPAGRGGAGVSGGQRCCSASCK